MSDPDEKHEAPLRDYPPSYLHHGKSITTPNSPNYGPIGQAPVRHQSAPHSPPYRASDAQRPSLPPLKTVLSDNLSSPPQTPTSFSATFQPWPREPAYHTGTYKPPSLYPNPNKKQRVGPTPSSAPSFSNSGSINTANFPAPSFESDSRPLPSRTYPPVAMPAYSDGQSTRRFSLQPPSRSPHRLAQPDGTRYTASGAQSRDERMMEDARQSNGSQHYRTPDQTPNTTLFTRKFPPMVSSYGPPHDTDSTQTRLEYPSQLGYPPSRRTSTDDPAGRFECVGNRTARRSSYHPGNRSEDPRSEYGPGIDGRSYARVDHPLHNRPSQFDRAPYEPSFFMPSQYDYQHGKARKRSNLPKQSTEIMKNWFDQNMTNPYPSEEQKAIFSSATGISMTQVSNWFINHRRRCPELRDRREKHRSSGREVDMI